MTATALMPSKEQGRKNERRCITFTDRYKKAIDEAAVESNMSASAYLELLLNSTFGETYPKLGLAVFNSDGTKQEVPAGLVHPMRHRTTGSDKLVRATYTLTPDCIDRIDEASEASQLPAATYTRNLVETKWPEPASLPHFGTAMFSISEGTMVIM